MSTKALIGLIALAALLAACLPQATPPPTATVDPNEVATIVAATLAADRSAQASATPSPTAAQPALLPASLYFLSNSSGSRQVWRLEADGETLTQITEAEGDVTAFDISSEGQLAYVSDNQLWLAGALGGSRQLLVDGSSAQDESDEFYYRQRISAPRLAPGGQYLAYGQDGLRLLDLESGDLVHLLVNQVEEEDERLFPEELYFPEAWSPDGERLLVSIGYLEGGSLAILDFDREELVRFEASGVVCCQSAWTPDSAAVLVASPYIGLVEPGLWRYAAANGEETVLAYTEAEAGATYEYFGWPAFVGDDELAYFYTSSAGVPEGNLAHFMVRGPADGGEPRQQLRPESFSLREALWAPDGSLALVIENPPVPEGGVTGGTILLVHADGSSTQALAADASAMQWGP